MRWSTKTSRLHFYAVFAVLRLWQDGNHNAHSEAGELHNLNEFAIESIDLNFKESRRRDKYGNEFRFRSKLGGSTQSPAMPGTCF